MLFRGSLFCYWKKNNNNKVFWCDIKVKIVLSVLGFGFFVNVFVLKRGFQFLSKKKEKRKKFWKEKTNGRMEKCYQTKPLFLPTPDPPWTETSWFWLDGLGGPFFFFLIALADLVSSK
jgi:hypothetical protein